MTDFEDARRALDVARGKRVRAVREEAGWDQPTFVVKLNEKAEALGIPERYYASSVSRTEGGKRGVSLSDAVVISAVDPKNRTAEWIALGPPAEKVVKGKSVVRENPDTVKRRAKA